MRKRRGTLINAGSLVIVLLIALVISAIVFYIMADIQPGNFFWAILYGAVGSVHNITESVVILIPLLLCGLGIAFAFKAGIWNVGAEGQLFMGAIGATFVALNLSAPAPLHLLLIILGAFLAGGIWGAIGGVLKAKLGVNEILSTIMLNYIALWTLHYLVYNPWRAWERVLPQTAAFPMSARLPELIPDMRLHAGLFVALGAAVFTYVVFKYRRLGYAIRVIGTNPKAAQYGGINLTRTIIITMFISGGLAGLAGMCEVCGIQYALKNGAYPISPGYGYIAIGVALLGGLQAWGTVLASAFFACLYNGATFMKTIYGLHDMSLLFLVGILILAVLSRGMFRHRLARLSLLRGED